MPQETKMKPHMDTEAAEQIGIIEDRMIIVDWSGPDDPDRPANWSFWRKWAIVISTSLATFMVSFGSGVFSGAIPQVEAEFHISNEVATLGIALYVLGFAFGPMVWGPLSELYGKRRPLFTGYLLFCVFQIPVAVAKPLPVILVFRFLSGLMGSAPLAIISGMYVDFLTNPTDRGISSAIFSVGTFCGPVAGPIIGNLATVRLGWRWTAWLTLLGAAISGIPAYLLTPETSEVIILRRKAEKLRQETGEENIGTKDKGDKPSVEIFVQKYLTKPLRMFALEPILVVFTIYMSLAYAIIYMTFVMYPVAFVNDRGWGPIQGSLPFLAISVGVILASTLLSLHSIYLVGPLYEKTSIHIPERRLPPMILGSFILPGGIFWFAWTSDTRVSWVPQVLAGIFIGCGSILVFMSGVVYLVEVYLQHANSALAINNFLRSAAAAAFVIFAPRLFTNMGMSSGGSVLGGICAALIPFPLIFWKYGHVIRNWSKFAFH